jgi:hypothetical protein
MANMTSGTHTSISRLILVPAVITLAITILRVVGELQNWSPVFFNRSAGGAFAPVGIWWLPIIFGPYFALKLAGGGRGASSIGKTIGMTFVGFVVMVAGGFLGFAPMIKFPGKMVVGMLLIAAAAFIPLSGWGALTKTLLAYAYAARVPVAIAMFFAIRGNWGTHYDALPPNYTGPMNFWGKYFMIGLLPQLVFWVAYTVILGSLAGGITAAIARGGKAAPQAAS